MTSSPRKMRTNGQLFVGATLCGRPRIAHKVAKTVYRLGQIYFILARSDSCAVAQNSLTQNKIYPPSPLRQILFF